ncbi:MAG: oligoendopeptidase F [Oscillospiraceae bacterium]|nr:oligoendopeptidase F [Oscillospiraceae bacterium]
MTELKARKDMDPAYQWDFTPIYPSREAWEAEFRALTKETETVAALKGTFRTSPQSLKQGLDTLFALEERLEKCVIYAMLHQSADGGDEEYQAMNERAENLANAYSSAVSFLEPEILSIDPDQLSAWLDWPEMALYRHRILDICRSRDHVLDEATEGLLARLARPASAPGNAFSMLHAVDMTFPKIKDEEGNEVALTNGNFEVFRVSRDPRVREDAFRLYFGAFEKFKNTLTALYSGNVQMDNFRAVTRHYPDACTASLDGNNVPVSVYDSLVSAVHEALPDMRRYLEIRRKRLGLEELHLCDLYTPIVENVEFPVSFAESRDLVKKALLPLGAEYQTLLDRAYDEKWMDVYENKGKDTGAFSCGIYGVHPYVLLNYTDTLEDAFTVAHELGHSMHSFFSDRANAYANAGYSLMVAEVASTVNEVLLSRYLLKTETDPRRKAYVLNRFLEGFRTTLFRQTLFAEFERKAHEMDAAGEPLTASALSQVYHELNALYYDGCVTDGYGDIEWARIPHFYRSFYVYQYATGFSSAVAIAQHILDTGDASGYLRFLTTGGSDYPLEELKVAGVDLTKPETVKDALAVFSRTLTEFEEILNSL